MPERISCLGDKVMVGVVPTETTVEQVTVLSLLDAMHVPPVMKADRSLDAVQNFSELLFKKVEVTV